LIGHNDGVSTIVWDQLNKYLVSGSYDYTLRVWDVEKDFNHIFCFTGHSDNVNEVCFGKNNETIFSGIL